MPRGPNRPHPPVPFQKAADVAQAITDNNAGASNESPAPGRRDALQPEQQRIS